MDYLTTQDDEAWDGGWGAWGTLSSIGLSVQKAAATAAGDIAQLTTSFQQVLNEMAADDDVAEDVVDNKRGDAGKAIHLAEPVDVDTEGDRPETMSPGQQSKREEVLARLHGEPTSRDQLLARLQAVDEGVDRVAQEATAALSSLWGWGAGVVKARAAEDGGLLGGLRARAQTLLADVVGENEVHDHHDRASAKERKNETLGLDQCLFIYGGTQAREELEALSADSARSANRAASIEELSLASELVRLTEILTLREPSECDGTKPEDRDAELDPRGRGLRAGHALVEDVVDAATRKLAKETATKLSDGGTKVLLYMGDA